MAHILVLDDEPKVCALLTDLFHRDGHDVSTAGTLAEGLAMAASNPFDLVFLDVRLPDGNGLRAIPRFSAGPGEPEVVIMTGYGEPDGAELAISNGAWDYLQKPPSINQFLFTLEKAIKYRTQKNAHSQVKRLDRSGLIGESPLMKQCYEIMASAATLDASVLITGETGTGKEIFASVLHRNSPRASRAFVPLDCASLSKHLVESTLFGHRKGAFTGADTSTRGVVKQADRGTLFLDEIGELPLDMQKKLLRVLQEKRYRPVGSEGEEASNFRLVAATNRDLEDMVSRGLFREDLFFRLNAYHVKLPPLKARKEDIRDIIAYHLKRLCRNYQIPTKGISQDFFMVLEAYDWPGNVRELLNVLEMALGEAMSEPNLFSKHLPVQLRAKVARDAIKEMPDDADTQVIESLVPPTNGSLMTFREYRNGVVEQAEKKYLVRLVVESDRNFLKAIEISGLAKTRLYNLFKKHDISFK